MRVLAALVALAGGSPQQCDSPMTARQLRRTNCGTQFGMPQSAWPGLWAGLALLLRKTGQSRNVLWKKRSYVTCGF